MKTEPKYDTPEGCAEEALAIFFLLPLLPLFALICLAKYASRKISYWVYWCYDSITDKMTEDE